MTKYLDNEGLTHFTGKMKEYADGKAGEVDGKVTTHVGNEKNPHKVTKAQVGLGSVDNVQQIPLSQKGVENGVATLDAKGKVPVEQMPETKTINGASIFGSGNLQLSASLYKIVDTLPTTGIDTSKIYLVPAATTADKNNKTEYIYLGDPSKAYDATKWEKLGEEQKNATIETPGGSIVVDTAFDTSSSNPIANKTVALKLNTIENTLNGKVAQEEYNTNKTTVNNKLKALEDKTITTDSELSESSVNPIQTQAVYKEVQKLNKVINGKANTTALTSATDRIAILEENSATGVTESGEGNGIASIKKVGKDIVATKGTFVTSLAGYATTAAMNTALAKKAEKEHTHSQYALTSALSSYVTSTALTTELANYATKGWIGEQSFAKTSAIPTKTSQLENDSKFLTAHQSLAEYVNDVKTTEVTNGNGIASIKKNGNALNVTQGAFLTAIDGIIAETGEAVAGKGVTDISIRGNKLVKKTGTFVTPATLGDAIDDYASDKGYLTENNLNEKLKETVTIKLVSDKSASDTNLNGATITVKSGDTTVSTQTWQGTPINVKVPCDKEVTIEAATVKMYVKPKVLKYIPSPLYNREVTFTYKALETGVFIIDKNDKTYKTAGEFKNSGTDIKDVIGTLLVTDNAAIVVANYNSEYVSWGPNVLVDGCTVANDTTTAVQDFAGAANTAAIMKATGSSSQTAAYICYNYIFGNGRRGHLMSAGEGAVIQKMRFDIQRLMSQIGIDDSSVIGSNKYYWTSTQISASKVYRYRFYESTPDDDTKDNVNYAIPIYSLFD